MAKSIVDQLHKLGLVGLERLERERSRRALEEEAERLKNRPRGDDRVEEQDLLGCANVRDFRNTAKRFLLQDSSRINAAIRAAHNYSDRRLIGQLYGLRTNLQSAPPDKHAQLIKRALRGAGRKHNRDI